MQRQSQGCAEHTVRQSLFLQPLGRGQHQGKLGKIDVQFFRQGRGHHLQTADGQAGTEIQYRGDPQAFANFFQPFSGKLRCFRRHQAAVLDSSGRAACGKYDNIPLNQFFRQFYRAHVMPQGRQVGTAYHAGYTLDFPGHNEIQKGLPGFTQEFVKRALADSGEGILISVLRKQTQLHLAPAFLVGFHHRIHHPAANLFPAAKGELHQLRIGFFRHIVQADLLDFQSIADRLNPRKGAVKLGENRIDSSRSQHCLAGVIIACMPVKNVRIVDAPQLQILAHAGTSYQLKSLGAGSLCLLQLFRGGQTLLEIHKDGMLMAGNHNVDVIRIDHMQPHRGHADLRLAQHYVI